MSTRLSSVMSFCCYVEGQLGWSVPSATADQRIRALRAEVGKVKNKIATDTDLYTLENLRITTDYLQGKRIWVSPVAVLSYVREALWVAKRKMEPTRPEIDVLIDAAVQVEQEQELAGWESRVRTLVRAQGPVRYEIYDEWLAERAG